MGFAFNCVWTSLVLVLFLDTIVLSEDCRPVGECIYDNGGTTFSVSFYPDFSSFNVLAYMQFLTAVCNHLQYFYICQTQNRTALTSSCEYLVGEYEGGIISTQSERQQLAETQCATPQDMANAVNCLISNSNIGTAVEACANQIAQRQGSLCNAVKVWDTCINGTVGGCTPQAISYFKTVTQKYIDVFCTNSMASKLEPWPYVMILFCSFYIIFSIYFKGYS